MWQYEGAHDASRMSPDELSKNELDTHVRSITSIKATDPCNLDCPVTPYGADNPLLEVSLAFMYLLSSGFITLYFCIFNSLDVLLYVQGHSTALTLPPLPENGPTHETEVQTVETKGGDESPLPSATTSPMEEVEEEEAEKVQTEEPATTDHVSEVPTRKRHRVARGLSSDMSSPAKDSDVKDDGDSH